MAKETMQAISDAELKARNTVLKKAKGSLPRPNPRAQKP